MKSATLAESLEVTAEVTASLHMQQLELETGLTARKYEGDVHTASRDLPELPRQVLWQAKVRRSQRIAYFAFCVQLLPQRGDLRDPASILATAQGFFPMAERARGMAIDLWAANHLGNLKSHLIAG